MEVHAKNKWRQKKPNLIICVYIDMHFSPTDNSTIKTFNLFRHIVDLPGILHRWFHICQLNVIHFVKHFIFRVCVCEPVPEKRKIFTLGYDGNKNNNTKWYAQWYAREKFHWKSGKSNESNLLIFCEQKLWSIWEWIVCMCVCVCECVLVVYLFLVFISS